MARGDHIYARRGRHYSHHGVDCGDGSVIHYAGPRGSVRFVERTRLEEFAAGAVVYVQPWSGVRHCVDMGWDGDKVVDERDRDGEEVDGCADYDEGEQGEQGGALSAEWHAGMERLREERGALG